MRDRARAVRRRCDTARSHPPAAAARPRLRQKNAERDRGAGLSSVPSNWLPSSAFLAANSFLLRTPVSSASCRTFMRRRAAAAGSLLSEPARSSGRNSNASATISISAASSMKNAVTSRLRIRYRRAARRRVAAPRAQDSRNDEHPDQHEGERRKPQQPRAGLERRVVEHEVVVARDQVVLDLVVAFSTLHHVVDLLAQILGQVGIGVGQVLILADQAAQLLCELLETDFLGAVFER
jgi:hypothetical protein